MPYKRKEDMAEYMRNYRDRQGEKAAQKDEWINEAYDLMDEFVRDQMLHGNTREQAEDLFKDLTTPPGETQSVNEAADSVPETKPDCFGKQFHKDSEKCSCSLSDDCHKAWVANMFKPRAVKDAEQRQKMSDLLAKSKTLVEGIERQKSAELWAKVQAQNDAAQKELDALVKKYEDRGIPEATAIETAKWEIKQKQNVEIQRNREFRRKWDLMTEQEQTAEKLRLLKRGKKLREGDTSHE